LFFASLISLKRFQLDGHSVSFILSLFFWPLFYVRIRKGKLNIIRIKAAGKDEHGKNPEDIEMQQNNIENILWMLH
jgi:hypothetical protein